MYATGWPFPRKYCQRYNFTLQNYISEFNEERKRDLNTQKTGTYTALDSKCPWSIHGLRARNIHFTCHWASAIHGGKGKLSHASSFLKICLWLIEILAIHGLKGVNSSHSWSSFLLTLWNCWHILLSIILEADITRLIRNTLRCYGWKKILLLIAPAQLIAPAADSTESISSHWNLIWTRCCVFNWSWNKIFCWGIKSV